MLARILFNLTFLMSMISAFVATAKWGLTYALPAAMLIFFVGLLFSFMIGILMGASSIVNE